MNETFVYQCGETLTPKSLAFCEEGRRRQCAGSDGARRGGALSRSRGTHLGGQSGVSQDVPDGSPSHGVDEGESRGVLGAEDLGFLRDVEDGESRGRRRRGQGVSERARGGTSRGETSDSRRARERERERKVPSYLRELVSGLDVGLAVLKGKSGLLDLAPLVWEEAEAANGEGRPVREGHDDLGVAHARRPPRRRGPGDSFRDGGDSWPDHADLHRRRRRRAAHRRRAAAAAQSCLSLSKAGPLVGLFVLSSLRFSISALPHLA